MNPNLTGSLSEVHTSERFLFTTPVCLGEEGFDGDMHFGYAHNTHFLILSKIKHPHEKESLPNMFHNLSHTNLPTYLAPDSKDTGSEVGEENFVLASFLRGERSFDGLVRNGVYHRKLVDVGNVWNNFEIFQLYSPRRNVTAESLLAFFGTQSKEFQSLLLGKGLCDSLFASTPCSPA